MAAADTKATNGFSAPAVVLCSIAALVFIVALSLFLQGGYLAAQKRETQAKTVTPVNEVLRAAQAEQLARLQEDPRWLDEQKTKAVMPVDAAMDRLAALSVAVQALPAVPAAEAPTAMATDHNAGR
jgi:hypothetical protein